MKAHCLPFSQIPHTTRLFTDFLSYSPKVQQFYPRSPYFTQWMKRNPGRFPTTIRGENVWLRFWSGKIDPTALRQKPSPTSKGCAGAPLR